MAINYFGEARMKQLLTLIKGQLDLKATPAQIAQAIEDANLSQYALEVDLNALDSFVGEIPDGYTEETIVAYINKKAEETLNAASGGSSESAASVLAALNTYKAENDPKVQANADAIDAIEADYLKAADKTELQTAIADAVKAHDESDAAHAALFKALNDKDTAMQGEIDALEAEVANKANAADIVDYTVTVAESSPEGYAKAYTFSQKGAEIATINIPKDMVVESGSVVELAEGEVEGKAAGTYIKLVLANATEDEIYINVADLIEYVTSGSVDGDQIMIAISADHKVTATLSAGSVTLAQLHADVQAEIAKAHEHGNKTVLDGIDADKVAGWDAAEQNAKDYADGLNTDMDTRVKAVEEAKHTHDNKAVLDTITQDMVDAWNTADTEYTEEEVTAMWNEVFGA